jgi:hypothetical protein
MQHHSKLIEIYNRLEKIEVRGSSNVENLLVAMYGVRDIIIELQKENADGDPIQPNKPT